MTLKVVFLVLLACLSGCAIDPTTTAVADAYRVLSSGGEHQSDRELNPNFKYLRVQIDDREVFMALGYVDQTPEGPVEVWYSSEADVLRLRDGRVVGATLKKGPDWSAVAFSHLPTWSAVREQAEFVRTRDLSPGYRYGIREKILIRRIETPDDTQLKVIPASSLTWFEEDVQGEAGIRPARYGVKLQGGAGHQVVYAEQCLSETLCFSWQSWPYSSKGKP